MVVRPRRAGGSCDGVFMWRVAISCKLRYTKCSNPRVFGLFHLLRLPLVLPTLRNICGVSNSEEICFFGDLPNLSSLATLLLHTLPLLIITWLLNNHTNGILDS
jgi:hypothetical protein